MRSPVRVPDTLSFTSRGVPFTVIFPTAVPLQFTERLPEAGLIPPAVRVKTPVPAALMRTFWLLSAYTPLITTVADPPDRVTEMVPLPVPPMKFPEKCLSPRFSTLWTDCAVTEARFFPFPEKDTATPSASPMAKAVTVTEAPGARVPGEGGLPHPTPPSRDWFSGARDTEKPGMGFPETFVTVMAKEVLPLSISRGVTVHRRGTSGAEGAGFRGAGAGLGAAGAGASGGAEGFWLAGSICWG